MAALERVGEGGGGGGRGASGGEGGIPEFWSFLGLFPKKFDFLGL